MPSPNVIVSGKTYGGVGRLSIPLTAGGGNGDFIYIGGEPGDLPQWQANVKIGGVSYNAVKRVTLPKSGGGEAQYLCAAGTFTSYTVNPGSGHINIGDYVMIEAGIFPGLSLYPSTSLYPSSEEMAIGLGTDSTKAQGIAMNDAEAGGAVLVYIPKA